MDSALSEAWGSRAGASVYRRPDSNVGASGGSSSPVYVKHTLLPSPVVVAVFPKFRVRASYPVGLASHMDEDAQHLWRSKDDLWATFDSEINLWDGIRDNLSYVNNGLNALTTGSTVAENNHTPQLNETNNHNHSRCVELLVKRGSLNIAGRDFKVNSAVRSCCIIHGSGSSSGSDSDSDIPEDSLLVSLESGYIVLVRVYVVPVNLAGRVGHTRTHLEPTGLTPSSESELRPYIVQWWSTDHIKPHTSLNIPGDKLLSNTSSKSVVVTSPTNMMRIHRVMATNSGIELSPHFNVRVPGIIVHCCLSETTTKYPDNFHTLFVASFTSSRRLYYNIFTWDLNHDIQHTLQKYTLPMENTTQIPIMVASLPNNLAYLEICRNSLLVFGIDSITSASYKVKHVPFEGSFPTACYAPKSSICAESNNGNDNTNNNTDEVLIATENGTIYSVVVNGMDNVTLRPIARVSDPVSVFTFEANNSSNNSSSNGYIMTYASNAGSNRKIFVDTLLLDEETTASNPKTPYSVVKTLIDYKSWSPLTHVKVVSKTDGGFENLTSLHQELWAISGEGKRSRLVQLRNGLVASRASSCYDKLKKCMDIAVLQWNGKTILACSLSFETLFLEYTAGLEDCFAELIDEKLPTDGVTLAMALSADTSTAMIFKSDGYVATNFEDTCDKVSLEHNSTYLFVAVFNGQTVYDIQQKLESNGAFFTLQKLVILDGLFSVANVKLDFEPSSLYVGFLDGIGVVFVGTYDSRILVYNDQLGLLNSIDLSASLDTSSLPSTCYTPAEYVPNQMLVTKSNNALQLVVTTKGGRFIILPIISEYDFDVDHIQDVKIDDCPVQLVGVPGDPASVLLVSLRLWMVNLSNGMRPRAVYFDERKDRTIKRVFPVAPAKNMPYFLVRDDGLCVAQVPSLAGPNLRQMTIGEDVKALEYLENSGLFAVFATLKKGSNSLKIVDRKYLKLLQTDQVPYKGALGEDIFSEKSSITCSCIWSVVKEGRVAKRLLLVGCSDGPTKGSIKVLDISKSYKDDTAVVKVSELFVCGLSEVPFLMAQVGTHIVYSTTKSLYSIAYEPENKAFGPSTLCLSLPSAITSLNGDENGFLYVTTEGNSVFHYELRNSNLEQIGQDPYSRAGSSMAINAKADLCMVSSLSYVLRLVKDASTSLRATWSYQFSFLPKVYSCGVSIGAISDTGGSGVVCVGCDGTVVAIQTLGESSELVTKLNSKMDSILATNGSNTSLPDKIADALDYPVVGSRMMGRGLMVLNRPCFDYEANRRKLVDCDLDQIEELCSTIDF